jgi:hypothetical protein
MNSCPRCGAATIPTSRFCGTCGNALVLEATPPVNAKPSAPKNTSTMGTMLAGVFAVVIGILVVWFFLPGIFDSSSASVFDSKSRRSPLLDVAGPTTVLNTVVKAEEDHYAGHTVRIGAHSKVSVDVTYINGPQVEVYVLTQAGYKEFDAAAGALFGGEFHRFEELSGRVSSKTSLHKSGKLSPGDYVILIDNSDFGDVSPPANFNNDVAEVRVQVTVE